MLKVVLILAGGVAGALLTGIVFSWLLYQQQQQHVAELAAVGLVANHNPLQHFNVLEFPKEKGKEIAKPKAKMHSPEEQKVVDLCLEMIKDLEKNRLSSVYRLTSDPYQKKNERKMFDQKLMPYRFHLQNLEQDESKREYKIAKLIGDKGFDFYFTGQEKRGAFGEGGRVINITFTLVLEQADWRIDELEVTTDRP